MSDDEVDLDALQDAVDELETHGPDDPRDDVQGPALPVDDALDRDDGGPTYWLPKWWDAVSDWSKCRTCIRRNGSPCVSCEVPPGLLAMAQLVGGGVATVAGNARGNQTITSQRQAQAAGRVPSANQADVQVAIEKSKVQRLREKKSELNRLGGGPP